MAEAAGLALGVLGVIGTFKNCIDLFSLFSSYRSLGRDHEILEAKLHVEKAILLQWAHRVQLLEPEYDPRLDDAISLDAISRVLASIQYLMSETSLLQERYGVEQTEKPLNSFALGSRSATVSKARMERFARQFEALQVRIGQKQKANTASNKLRWIITDKEKFDKLIQELSHFIEKLNQLIPETSHGRDPNREAMARRDLAAIKDVKALRVIRDATSDRKDVVSTVVEERLNQVCQQSMLSLIWFRSMDDRRDGVACPHPETFEWALEPPGREVEWDDLAAWLRTGSGLYWICGKAGSGKSTLMKYLYYHQKTDELLRCWAGSEPLSSGSFFFWNLGNSEQRSLDGLSRAILYQILDAEPTLSSVLLPRLWRETLQGSHSKQDVPSQAEMTAAFETLAGNIHLPRHFCFFIDGLDEYTGNYLDGIRLVRGLIRNPRVKILVSSRPIPACVDSFSSMPKLKLQDLTKADVESYVQDTVGSHPYMVNLVASDPTSSDAILQQLIEKAAGVFLWVVLACRSLLNGFAAYDRIEELSRRVDELPPEIDNLFQHMLGRVESRYHEQMVKMLRICYQRQIAGGRRDEVATIYTIAMAIFDSQGFKCDSNGQLQELTRPQHLAVCAPMEGRLRSRCGGLLEVRRRSGPLSPSRSCFCGSRDHDPLVHSTIEFMHRSVFEFLDRSPIWNTPLFRIVDDTFNANAALSLMNLQLSYLFLRARKNPDHFLADGIHCAQLADAESSGSGFAILSKVEQVMEFLLMEDTRTVAAHQETRRNECTQPTEDSSSLVLAVESGMINCVRYYLPLVDESTLPFPLLYYAIRKPMFRGQYHLPPSDTVIRYLLLRGLLPNKEFTNQEGITTTPWREWLQVLHLMESPRFFAAMPVTEEFINGGADLNFQPEPVEVILQKHLNNTLNFTTEGRERIRKGMRLLEYIKDGKEALDRQLDYVPKIGENPSTHKRKRLASDE